MDRRYLIARAALVAAAIASLPVPAQIISDPGTSKGGAAPAAQASPALTQAARTVVQTTSDSLNRIGPAFANAARILSDSHHAQMTQLIASGTGAQAALQPLIQNAQQRQQQLQQQALQLQQRMQQLQQQQKSLPPAIQAMLQPQLQQQLLVLQIQSQLLQQQLQQAQALTSLLQRSGAAAAGAGAQASKAAQAKLKDQQDKEDNMLRGTYLAQVDDGAKELAKAQAALTRMLQGQPGGDALLRDLVAALGLLGSQLQGLRESITSFRTT
jgi:chromosome segregation ATPase